MENWILIALAILAAALVALGLLKLTPWGRQNREEILGFENTIGVLVGAIETIGNHPARAIEQAARQAAETKTGKPSKSDLKNAAKLGAEVAIKEVKKHVTENKTKLPRAARKALNKAVRKLDPK